MDFVFACGTTDASRASRVGDAFIGSLQTLVGPKLVESCRVDSPRHH